MGDMTRAGQNEIMQQIRQEYEQQVEANQLEFSEASYVEFVEAHDAFQKIASVNQMRCSVVERLRHQAMPAQINFFEQYSKANPSLLDVNRNASEALAKLS